VTSGIRIRSTDPVEGGVVIDSYEAFVDANAHDEECMEALERLASGKSAEEPIGFYVLTVESREVQP
jgi:hypothetical protein